jgi:hypothetical protein
VRACVDGLAERAAAHAAAEQVVAAGAATVARQQVSTSVIG